MKYALIGCGRIAPCHINAAIQNGLEIVAVCDLVTEKMDKLLSRFNLAAEMPNNCAGDRASTTVADPLQVGATDSAEGCPVSAAIQCYTDYHQMLSEHPELELISIATVSGTHAKIALDCIDHGVNLIIEKPIAMSMEDADEIVKRSREKHVLVSACHQNRFNSAVQKLRVALDEGRFGKLSHASIAVRWMRNQDYYKEGEWRGTWALDGGTLMNQCIHGIDLVRWMMGGDIVSVYGVTRRREHDYIEAEDIGLAILEFRDGTIATIEGTANVFPENLEEVLCLFGESGTVKIGGESVTDIDVWKFADQTKEDDACLGLKEETTSVYGNGHVRLFADVKSAIIEGRDPYVTALDGRNALEVILAIYKSMKLHAPVELPLKDFASSDMAGTF